MKLKTKMSKWPKRSKKKIWRKFSIFLRKKSKIRKFENLNMRWFSTRKKWYFSIFSKFRNFEIFDFFNDFRFSVFRLFFQLFFQLFFSFFFSNIFTPPLKVTYLQGYCSDCKNFGTRRKPRAGSFDWARFWGVLRGSKKICFFDDFVYTFSRP